jgi:DNA primase
VGFREALEMLAQRVNLELPKQYRAPGEMTGDSKARLYEVVAWAEQQFHECLLRGDEGEPARRYLRDRGISGQSITKFRLGYHPKHWEWLLERARNKYTPELLATVKLVAQREGSQRFSDYFVDRVLFPIRDSQGRPVSFGGRVLPGSSNENGPKYWNGLESILFNKSRLLYGLDQARETISKSDEVVVVEGYTDCIMAHQHGLTNFVATLGTALNENHVTNLKRFARRVVLVYDGDDAGQRATDKALPRLLAQEIDLRILTLPGGLDPAEHLEQHGGESLRTLLAQAVEAWDHKFRTTIARHGLESIDSRHRVLEEMLEILAMVPVTSAAGLAGKWQERESVILGRLAQRLKVTESFARQRLDDLRKAGEQRGLSRPKQGEDDAVSQRPAIPLFPAAPTRDEKAERELLEIIFTFPERVAEIQREIPVEEISNPHLRRLLGLCFEISSHGGLPSYEKVTSQLEDAGLKALAAQIDEHAQHVRITPELIAHTLDYFVRRHEARLANRFSLGGTHGPDPPTDVADPSASDRLRAAMELHRKRVSRSSLK